MARTRFVAALLVAAALTVSQGTSAVAADFEHPTVIELFQSQGCSSCPPANANLNAIAGRSDVLALSFAVTYWDQLGWKDIFAQPAFTQRQWDYAKSAGRGNVSTPQMIVNGRGVMVGNRSDQVIAFARRYDRGATGPAIVGSAGRVSIGMAAAKPAIVWLVRYDPRVLNVPIRAGENGGRTLPHRNIVRSLQTLGRWRGAAISFAVPPSPNRAYRSAVLVQQGSGGPIIAARTL
ncbi:MAG: DUF1223 domain-containing protein [Sphingomicrobium sp.]